MAASDEWRWTDDQGVQRVVHADELRSALASSVLAPSTLVWREGMTSWVPAFTVPELGAAPEGSSAELPPDGTTDIGAAVQLSGGSELSSITSADGVPPVPHIDVPPPPLVTAHKVTPHPPERGSTADTGRPTPTALLEGMVPAGGTTNGAGAPRPAAGREAAAPLKISAAPRPIVAPALRPAAGKADTAAGASSAGSKSSSARAGAWRKPELGKDDVTLVAEASEPFKLKQASEAASPRATPSPTKATRSETKGTGTLATRRPVTRTALIPGSDDAPRAVVRPAAGRPASVPPAPLLGRRPSTVPPAPFAGRRPSTVPPRPRSGGSTPPPRTPTLNVARSTAFAGSPARALNSEGALSVPVAPRIPNIVKPVFAIVEHTSTDSTGVLPLSGQYAAEPRPDDAPRPHSPSYVDGAPPFVERTPSFPDVQPSPTGAGPMLLGAASEAPAREPERAQAYAPPAALAHTSGPGAPGSYPPVPQPMFGPGAATEGQPGSQAYGPPPAPAYPEAPAPRRMTSTLRMNSQPPSGYAAPSSPYSAPPPPLALSHPSIPDVRSSPLTERPPAQTAALPLPDPKRSYTPPPLDQVDHSALPPEAFAEPPARMGDPVTVPLSSLFGAGGILIAMTIGAFFFGRCSAGPGPTAPPARAALAALPRLARASIPTPPKPCWMAKQPVRWAPSVLQRVPVDVAPSPSGVVVAYARDSREPATVEVDFDSGSFDDKPRDKLESDIVRVLAPREGGKLLATTQDDAGPLAPYTYAPGAAPFLLGVAGRGTPSPSVAAADTPEGAPVTLWSVPAVEEDKGLEAARVLEYGKNEHALVFRRSGSILGGFIGEGHKPVGGLGVVAGSGGSIGKPSLGSNRRELAVIFADKAGADTPWEIRLGHAPLGEMPRDTVVVPLPKGGPGGDAFAPDIAGTADGRWVLVWTEGRSGAYAVRAQTLGVDFKPLGDPIAVSPPAGNYGQAVVGVAGGYVTTMFLSKGTSGSYELWGAVLQCGS